MRLPTRLIQTSEPNASVTSLMAESLDSKGSAAYAVGPLNNGDPESGHRSKRIRLEGFSESSQPTVNETRKGVAPVKPEFLLPHQPLPKGVDLDDDRAEAAPHVSGEKVLGTRKQDDRAGGRKGKQKQRGQNQNRRSARTPRLIQLCASRARSAEFSPGDCQWGNGCRFSHDLREFLQSRDENGYWKHTPCPNVTSIGWCEYGWNCYYYRSHSQENIHEDGRSELVLLKESSPIDDRGTVPDVRFWNVVSNEAKHRLERRQATTPRSQAYEKVDQQTIEDEVEMSADAAGGAAKEVSDVSYQLISDADGAEGLKGTSTEIDTNIEQKHAYRAAFVESPLLPSEKRRIYFGPDTPLLAPLTTQGNLPFRQLCVSLGAQLTYSEMAVSSSILQGKKSEWALMKAHQSEQEPARPGELDTRFGAQIAASKASMAWQATETIAELCPRMRVIDLNCGCPIDLIYQSGGGSALMGAPAKLKRMLSGMSAVSGPIPVSVKIRMGVYDNKPTADKLITRLIESTGHRIQDLSASTGVAAITLHGRSRQQRYTKAADWAYIASCAAVIKEYRAADDRQQDTSMQNDARDQPNGGGPYFIGNGDVYSHVDYQDHIDRSEVDAVMVARGALVKPWL